MVYIPHVTSGTLERKINKNITSSDNHIQEHQLIDRR